MASELLCTPERGSVHSARRIWIDVEKLPCILNFWARGSVAVSIVRGMLGQTWGCFWHPEPLCAQKRGEIHSTRRAGINIGMFSNIMSYCARRSMTDRIARCMLG